MDRNLWKWRILFRPGDRILQPPLYQASDDRVLSLYESPEGLLYIGTHFGGLDIVHLNTRSVTNYSVQNRNFPDSQIEAIFRDSYGDTWVGTWKGLMRFVKGKKEPELIELDELKNAKVNCIEENRLGQLWIGTEYFLCSIKLKESDEEIKKATPNSTMNRRRKPDYPTRQSDRY